MIFTAYIDESDTHGATPDMTMTAMLGYGRAWELFGRGLARLQERYGFKVLHAVDFKARTGEFKGWSDQKLADLYNDIGVLSAKYLTETISVNLNHEIYRKHFIDVKPQKMHRTSQYGILFFALLESLSKRVLRERGNHRLSVVVESGHKNASDTARLFQERKREWEAEGNSFLKTHTISSKSDSPFLMAADITGHGAAMRWRDIRRGRKVPIGEREVVEPRRGEAGWTLSEITPDYLTAFIDKFNRERAAKHERYLERRATFLSSRGEGQPS